MTKLYDVERMRRMMCDIRQKAEIVQPLAGVIERERERKSARLGPCSSIENFIYALNM